MNPSDTFEPVIGLEIHVQLSTADKMFCASCAAYGAPPNTQVCPVCLGLPGSLPTVNARAVELGVRAALALGCSIHPRSVFARKNYFYPDLPKGYQISQHDRPFATEGQVRIADEAGDGTTVRIRRVHLEEDSGKSIHDRIAGATAIDLNRAGVPLIEIVTEPDLTFPAQARDFLVRLRRALEYLEVSDCNMEEGSLRVDANVSVRPVGQVRLGTKTEVKNMNSFSGVERALHFEIRRQERLLRSGGTVHQQTLLWDAARGEARPMRSKEESHDYRYFPEPDLPPLEIDAEWMERIRAELPEMPAAREERFIAAYGLSPQHAETLTATRALADFFEATVRQGADAQEAANWIMGDVLAAVNAQACSLDDFRVRPDGLAELLALLDEGTLSRPIARQVFARMAETGRPAARIVEEEGRVQVRDTDQVERWLDEVMAAHPEEVERFRAGEGKLMGFFVGQLMRRSGGKADPKQVNATIRAKLGK